MTAPLRLLAVAFTLAAALPVAAESAKPPARPTPAAVDLNPDGSVPDKIVYAGKETPGRVRLGLGAADARAGGARRASSTAASASEPATHRAAASRR